MTIVVLCKPCDISGGVMVTVLPDTGRHSNRTGASLNRASIFRAEKKNCWKGWILLFVRPTGILTLAFSGWIINWLKL